MARFDTSGIDEIIREVTALVDKTDVVGTRMLMAGAEEVKKAWKQAASKHKLHDTGDMIDSIDYARTPKDIDDAKCIDIYPQGIDRDGVSNAEKAFVLHYGTSSKASIKNAKRKARRRHKKYVNPGIPATHWVDDADAIAAPRVQEVFEKIWAEHLEGEKTNGS